MTGQIILLSTRTGAVVPAADSKRLLLSGAGNGKEMSVYHLEAAIAYLHAVHTSFEATD
jgi:hypothetical protein